MNELKEPLSRPNDPEPEKRMTFPNPMLVVVSGPSGVGKSTIVAELAARLEGRGSEDSASMAVRRRNAEIEMSSSDDYDYVIVNETGRPDAAADRIWEIIQAEARRDPPRQVQV